MPIKNVITVAQKTWVISEIKESKKNNENGANTTGKRKGPCTTTNPSPQ